MEVEVVSAGIAAHHLRGDGYGGREQNDDRADQAAPAIPCSLIPDPCSLVFHGSSRSVCFARAVTAAALNGSAKVVPP